ncbi:hypothetical protein COSO111634_23455 [Corallococcus soli]
MTTESRSVPFSATEAPVGWSKVKPLGSVAVVPSGFTTVTSTTPRAPLGVVTSNWLSPSTRAFTQSTCVLKQTFTVPVGEKPCPDSTRRVPPAVGPRGGASDSSSRSPV